MDGEMMRKRRWMTILMAVLLFFATLPEAQGAGKLEAGDFTVKGVALGDPEEKMLEAFGKPTFDKERTVWGIHMRYYSFPHGYEVGVAVAAGKVADILVLDEDYKGRADVRYGATAHKILATYGKKERTFLEGSTWYIYENPADKREKLMLKAEPVNGSLLSWRLTRLPLTEEEAAALTDEERREWENNDLRAIDIGDKEIDTSAWDEQETKDSPQLRWERKENKP